MFIRTLFTVLLVSLAACASAPPEPQVDFNQQYDFSTIKTIAFYHDGGTASGGVAAAAWLSDMVHNRVDEGLKYALEVKGFTVIEDENAADALISWHLATEEKTDVRTYSTGMSGGYGAYGYGGYGRRGGYIPEGCESKQGACRDANERVHNVPAGVHSGYFVRHEFYAVHERGSQDDQRVLDDFQCRGRST